MARLKQQLTGHTIIGLDTPIFIYHLEAHPRYLPLTSTLLNGVEFGRWRAVTSAITVMEITVHPWRVNRADVARQYEVILANFPNLQIVDIGRDVARKAAQLRATYNIWPADALQVAAALTHQATVWISNDKKLRRLSPTLDIVLLDEFVEA